MPTFLLRDIDLKDIPALLGAMSVANTLATFALTSALGRIATSTMRRSASTGVVLSWVAMVLVGANYVVDIQINGTTGTLVQAGLLLWLASFLIVSLVLYRIAAIQVNDRRTARRERGISFDNCFNDATFGVPFVDDAIEIAVGNGLDIYYPVLLTHDRDAPGLATAMRFVHAGISAGDAVIYLTFARPASILIRQLTNAAGYGASQANVYLVDCYSAAYMPEQLRARLDIAGDNILFADPRDPASVYRAYVKALSRASGRFRSCRAVYESLSDFVRVSDIELVQHYLRRTVVLEEQKRIRAVYLLGRGMTPEAVNEQYLYWFYSTVLHTSVTKDRTRRGRYAVHMERMFDSDQLIHVNETLQSVDSDMFELHPDSVNDLARRVKSLRYVPAPYSFLPADASDRARHTANFVLFMVAIDHNTHSDSIKYETTTAGQIIHGSDLLYEQAKRAWSANHNLFDAAVMATATDGEVESVFRTPEGTLPADVGGRAAIWRELGTEVVTLFRGDFIDVVARCNTIQGPQGLLREVSRLTAFRDPIAKKANLLCKLLIREGLFAPSDRDTLDVPVDHVLMTMALRSGVVRCHDTDLLDAMVAGRMLNEYAVTKLRLVTSIAFRNVAMDAGMHPDVLDDLLWSYGRKSLRMETPLPAADGVHSELDSQIERTHLPAFVARLNGLFEDSPPELPRIREIRFPFTRFF